ncbi:MAG: hypothetical protein GY799_07735 [Desulfobulbaceae bacterium]|nr:hypothetical protein [Aestuariibacter sp.]MCP4338767.1 hypothetical protein [Desulfobulbaceae bacterium]
MKAASEILGSGVRPIDTVTSALDDVVYRYESELLGRVDLFCTAAIGFVSGGIATGSLRGALVGAFSAAAFQQIGQHFRNASDANLGRLADASSAAEFDQIYNGLHEFGGNMLTSGQIAGQIASHAAVGGVISTLSGGKFGHGFFSAGFTKGAGTPMIGSMGDNAIGATLASAVIGGTASVISGGKFANGARTAAYQTLFNGLGDWFKQQAARYSAGKRNIGKINTMYYPL